VYTADAKALLLGKSHEAVTNPRAATEAHALVLAEAVRERLSATWGIGETGASGPTGNRYGDPPGHACIGVAGMAGQSPAPRATTLATGSDDREANMFAFAAAALRLLGDLLA
jgi:nicotinamide mononucleotide (NMN) deamidase PncC